MILKKYLISASAMAVLTGAIVPQVIAKNEGDIIVKADKQSGVTIKASNKTIRKGTKFNPLNGVSAIDFDGEDITRYILVTYNNVNENKAGSYKVGYAVLGKNGKRVDIEITVNVVEDSNVAKKTEIIAEDITLSKGNSFNPMKGVKAIDVTGADITQYVLVTKNNVNTSKPGKYEVTYVVLDTKGNRVYKTRNVEVVENNVSNKETKIIAEDKTIEKGSSFDPMKGVKAIDITGKDITTYVLVVENTVNTDRVGVGTVKYLVLDTEGNRVYKTIKVNVVNGNEVAKSEIIANNLTLNTGDTFEEKKGVTAIDVTGADITQYILVTKNNVNTNKPGKYEVTYVVLDTEGNRISKTIAVEVVGEPIVTDGEKAQEVIRQIDALKNIDDIELSDKDSIALVRDAYEKLSKEAKLLVSNLDKLERAESKIVELENKASAKVVEDKIATLDREIVYIDFQEIRNIREEYNTLNNEAKAFVANLNILEKAETELQEILDRVYNVINLIQAIPEDVTIHDRAQIEEARKAYDALSETDKVGVSKYTLTILTSSELILNKLETEAISNITEKIDALDSDVTRDNVSEIRASVDEVKKLIDSIREDMRDSITNMDKLELVESKVIAIENAIKEELDKESAKAVEDKIATLDRDITYVDGEIIRIIRAEYDALNPEAKAFVTNLNILEEAEAKLKPILEQVHNVIDLIQAIPSELNITHKTQVEEARNAYDALREVDKAEFHQNVLDILVNHENKMKEIVEKFDNAVQLIEALPENIELAHKTQVEEARNAYEALSDIDKGEVEASLVEKLENAELEIKKLEIIDSNPEVKDVITDIEALPAIDSISISDKDDIYGVMARFRALPEDVKFAVDATALFEAFDKVEGLLAEEINNEIADLPIYNDLTLDYKSTIEDLRNRYDALDDRNKGKVTLINVLEGLEERIIELESTLGSSTVDNVIGQIDALPEVADIQYSHETLVNNIKYLYESLNDSDKALVTNHNKLVEAEAEINRIKNGINEVLTAIHQIPALEDITLADKDVVEEARRVYDSYDEKVTYYINQMNVKDLINAEIKMEKLERLEADPEAKALVEKIDELAKKEITLDDKDAVVELRNIYNSLEPDSQRAIINIHLLRAFEEKIAELEKQNI